VDSEVLVPSPLQRRHVLRVPFQRLGDTIPFDELLDRHRPSVEATDRVLKTVKYGIWRSSRVKPFETVPLDGLDERWGRTLPGFDAPDLEVVVAGDLPEVLRQRAGVALALQHERHPVVVGFVLELNFDAFRDLRREGLAVIVVDVGVRGHPDGVDDAVDDPPAAGFQTLFRRQENLASECVDRFVTLDAAELRVLNP
jgi:hypothetical protein